MFEEKRNYRSDITGISVRLKSELVFEMGRNLQLTAFLREKAAEANSGLIVHHKIAGTVCPKISVDADDVWVIEAR